MGIWEDFSNGWHNGTGYLGDSIADWLGLGNGENDPNHPDAIDMILYAGTIFALLGLLYQVFAKFVYI